jgi:hypothetical protein
MVTCYSEQSHSITYNATIHSFFPYLLHHHLYSLMAPMSREEYEARYGKPQLEYLIRYKGGIAIPHNARNSKVLDMAVGLKLTLTEVQEYLTQPHVLEEFASKSWYNARVRARNHAATGDAVTSNNNSRNDENEQEEEEPFKEAEAKARGFLAEPHHDPEPPLQPWENNQTFAVLILKAEILVKAQQCADAYEEKDFDRMSDLEAELQGLYDHAYAINNTKFQLWRIRQGGPDEVYPMGEWAYPGEDE